jgi:hypothetical protein
MEFRQKMEALFKSVGFEPDAISDDKLKVAINLSSQRIQYFYAYHVDGGVELSVPSIAAFYSLDEIPHVVSTDLMLRSQYCKQGMWVIDKIGDKYVYSVMHYLQLQQLDSEAFFSTALRMVEECENFDNAIVEFINQHQPGTDSHNRNVEHVRVATTPEVVGAATTSPPPPPIRSTETTQDVFAKALAKSAGEKLATLAVGAIFGVLAG